MKFTCTQENLNKGLQLVSHIASKNTTLPILNNVLLKIEGGSLKLSSTNLEIGINSTVRGRVEAEGSFTVAAKLFSDYINLLPNEQVTLEILDNVLHINCLKHKTKINGVNAEEFPLIPQVEKELFVKTNAKDLKKSLSQVHFCAANDESRPEISGVLFIFEGNSLKVVATDGHRLAEKKLSLEKEIENPHSIIVPSKTITELIRSLSDGGDEDFVEVVLGNSQIQFNFLGTEIISRLIEGQYPDYRQIMPQNFKTTCSVSVTEVSKLVKSAGLFCRMGMSDIELAFKSTENALVVSSTNSSIGENVSSIDASVEGEPNNIVFNYRYLLDGFGNIESDDVEMCIIDGQNAGMFKSSGKDNYHYIIMPIKQ